MSAGVIEVEIPMKSSSPEEKLWSAVIALAIKDMWATPFSKNEISKRKREITEETASAIKFLMTDESDWIFDMLGFDGDIYRERIARLMRTSPDTNWRNARINYQRYLKHYAMPRSAFGRVCE